MATKSRGLEELLTVYDYAGARAWKPLGQPTSLSLSVGPWEQDYGLLP